MKAKYDFSKGKRGAVIPVSGENVRITIRLDRDIVDWFRSMAEKQGGGSYQAMLNEVLRKYIERQAQIASPEWHRHTLEDTERRLSSGQEKILEWSEAKNKLRKRFE